MDEKLLCMDEQRKLFLEMKSIPGEDAVKTAEMTWHKLSLIKQWQGFRERTPILKEVLLWVKCYHMTLHATEKQFVIGRVNQCSKLHQLSYFKKLLQPPPWSVNNHQHWGKTLYQQKASKKTGWSLRWWLAMKWLASFFSNEAFLKSV